MVNTTQRLLGIGVRHFGRDELARRLKTPPRLIDAWISGNTAMPDRKVLSLVDLIDELGALGDQAEN